MYYFQFFIEDNDSNPSVRERRLARLRDLALANNCTIDIEDHQNYSTVRIETPHKNDAIIFRRAAEPPLDEGIYQHDGVDKFFNDR